MTERGGWIGRILAVQERLDAELDALNLRRTAEGDVAELDRRAHAIVETRRQLVAGQVTQEQFERVEAALRRTR